MSREKEKVYKPSVDSYYIQRNSNPNKKFQTRAGIVELSHLSKAGLRRTMCELNGYFYLCAYEAHMLGYDYVILGKHRTNSGRPEAIVITHDAIDKGKKLAHPKRNIFPYADIGNPQKILGVGDVFVPSDDMPKKYKNLPSLNVIPVLKETKEHREDVTPVTPVPSKKDIGLSVHEMIKEALAKEDYRKIINDLIEDSIINYFAENQSLLSDKILENIENSLCNNDEFSRKIKIAAKSCAYQVLFKDVRESVV